MISHAAAELSAAARQMAFGTVAEFARAMRALGRGELDDAHAHMDVAPVPVRYNDEVGDIAASFNQLRGEIGSAVTGLDAAREGLRAARTELTESNISLHDRVDALRLAEDKLSGVLNSLDSVVWSLDVESRKLLYVSPAVSSIYGCLPEVFISQPELWREAVYVDDRIKFQAWLLQLLEEGPAIIQYRIQRPDGQLRWLEDKARVVRDSAGRALRFDGIASDISERKRHEIELDYLANNDPLTDLPNRNRLRLYVEQALSRAQRRGESVAMLFLDLDGFKFVNDSYGHALGDQLLKAVASRLKSAVRGDDTVARLGGDEFVILLQGLSDGERAVTLGRKLLDNLCLPIHVGDHRLHVTGSVGISLYPADGDCFETLLKHADVAMYRAKDQGRNGVRCYEPEMGARTEARMALESALRVALAEQQFELHYQPQYEMADGYVSGVEALIRWSHPELGVVEPARFIPLAEETGLIVPIGAWVLKTACAQVRAWQIAGYPELRIAVNVSARQAHDPGFPKLVQQTLVDTGLNPKYLQLELTETALIRDSNAVLNTLREIKALGVSLAMDDFGTGYSSLSYLHRFPFDTLKIDRSFIAEASIDVASITRAIVAMARALNLKTVAEGVETFQQLEFLHSNTCDAVQGHYLMRAMKAEDIPASLAPSTAVRNLRSLPKNLLRVVPRGL
jgi:diguanylate cyclase (GGDEF)-like protein/PAS domain S-box-containing protein